MSGRCERHDNWHAHCQRCCDDEIERLRALLRDALPFLGRWGGSQSAALAVRRHIEDALKGAP